MRYYLRLQPRWFPFGLVLLIAILVMCLSALLMFVLDFDLEASPVWQVVVYHLMLFLLFSCTVVAALQRPLCLGERYRVVMLVLSVATPMVVFTGDWVLGDAYSGFRDPRIFRATIVSASSFGILWMVVALPYSWFLLVRALFRHWCHRSPVGHPVWVSGQLYPPCPAQEDAEHGCYSSEDCDKCP